MPHGATLLSNPSNGRSLTSTDSSEPADTGQMGFNPYRKFVAKPADYAMVIGAVVAVAALLAWALLG